MFNRHKSFIYLTLSCLLSPIPSSLANGNALPEIGTTAGGTLSINQEIAYGDVYMRMLRSSQPLIHDPVLNEYVSSVGNKLVANADDVKMPFHFFLVRDRNINAYAFFGGYIALHSGLFLHSQSESELASVMAHEIAHVTQRHLARSMEEQARKTPMTIAALAGSLLLAIVSPEAGMAAISATQASSIQSRINYTRSNEKEADRFGLITMTKAGFSPRAMPSFFRRLADEYRYASTPPPFLLTHPLPEDRISDSQARANNLAPIRLSPMANFHFAKARIIARYVGIDSSASLDWYERRKKKTKNKHIMASLKYGEALVHLDNRDYAKAKTLLDQLVRDYPNNNFVLDAMSDLHIGLKTYTQGVKLLKQHLTLKPNNAVLCINLANILLKSEKTTEALKVLQRYTHEHPDDVNGWDLLAKTQGKLKNSAGETAALGELHALRGNWNKAIQNFTQASQLAELGSLEQARYDARIDQLLIQRERFMAFQ